MNSLFYSVKVRSTGFCRGCCGEGTIYQRGLDHRRQALATVLTLGFWAPVWLELWRKGRGLPWKCERCRERVTEPTAEARPVPWEGDSFATLSRIFTKRWRG